MSSYIAKQFTTEYLLLVISFSISEFNLKFQASRTQHKTVTKLIVILCKLYFTDEDNNPCVDSVCSCGND